MKDHIFRTYDIRGIVGDELDSAQVYDFAQALITYIHSQDRAAQTVAVGMDGRTHSPAIKAELIRGFLAGGFDVIDIGICPTPVLYFTMHTQPVDVGVVITASHNPKQYNGFKICRKTELVWGDEIKKLLSFYHRQLKNKERSQRAPSRQGSLSTKNMIEIYIDWLVNKFSPLRGMNLPIVIDCGNGATGAVMPLLIEKLEWPKVQLLYAEVDGTYPHHEADPAVAANMADLIRVVKHERAALGIAFDGDGDRMGAVTHTGEIVPGDALLALFAQPVVAEHPGGTVVFDIKASGAVVQLLTQWGANACMSPTGAAWVKKYMKEQNALLGGELSCHFFFHDRYFGYDDGIYAALRLVELLIRSGKTLHELWQIVPRMVSSPEIRIACSEEKKYEVVEAVKQHFLADKNVQILLLDGVRVAWPHGWGIVRVSNTQAVVSMRFEADDESHLKQVKNQFYQILVQYLDPLALRPHFEG